MPEDAGSIYTSLFFKLDELEKGIVQVHTKMDQLNKTTQTKAGGFASFWKNAFQTAFGFGVVQLIGKVVAAVKDAIGIFSGFQQSMQNVKSVTGATGEEFRLMTEKAKEAGETTRFTARQAADALYFLGSAGFSAQQSISALDGVLQLAGATQSDLASTSEAVASIISQYSLQAEDAARISNVFAAAIGNSQATMEKLTTSFRQVGPVAAGFGYTVEETTGILQELYNAGYQGENAGRALKSALSDLASPTSNLKNILGKLGVELGKVNPETNSFADIIDVLGQSGASTADIIDAFGKIAGPQMAVLIKQGGDALRQYTEDVTNTNAAAEAYAIQNDSLAGSMDFLKSKLEGTAIAIFEKLEPGMRDLIDSFINFLDAMKPVGETLGKIINFILQLAGGSINIMTKFFDVLTFGFKSAKTPMEEAGTSFDKVTAAIKRAGELGNTAKQLTKLTDEYEKLKSKTNLTQGEQDRLKSVIASIHKIMPDVITNFDEYGNAIEVSGEKSREAARKMLLAREATISAALTELKAGESILKNIVRENKAKSDAAKKERERLISESALAEARIATLDEFYNKYQTNLSKTSSGINAYNMTMKEMEKKLSDVGLGFQKYVGYTDQVLDQLGLMGKETEKNEKLLSDLQKSLTKPTEAEQLYKDATAKLKEIADLEKQLIEIQGQLTDIDKIDPVGDAPEKVKEFIDASTEFWNNYRAELERATRESSLFGNKQDVLKARLDFLKNAYLQLLEQGMDPASETMRRLRMEYDLTLLELNALIESERAQAEELQRSAYANKNILDTITDYTQKLEELGKTENELIEIERRRAIESVLASGASEIAMNAAIDAINEYYDKLKENSEETKKKVKITFEEIKSAAQELANALILLWQTVTNNRLDELDRQMQAEMEAAGVAEETERERLERELDEAKKAGDKKRVQEINDEIKRLEIKEEYEKKRAMLEYKAAMAEWVIKLASATASFYQAIEVATAALPWPANLPAIAYAIASGVNVGAVAAQKPKPPEFEGGGVFIGPKTGAQATLHGREMVLNDSQVQNLFDMINAGNTGGNAGSVAVTAIVEFDGSIIYKGVQTAQHDGIIKFKMSRLIK